MCALGIYEEFFSTLKNICSTWISHWQQTQRERHGACWLTGHSKGRGVLCTLGVQLESAGHSFLFEDEPQSCLAHSLFGYDAVSGQQCRVVLRDEVSVHISSFELWVARQPEQEVNIGAQADNLRREQSRVLLNMERTYSEKHLLGDPVRCHVEKGHTHCPQIYHCTSGLILQNPAKEEKQDVGRGIARVSTWLRLNI